jgi:hypothetical protein
MEHSRRKSDAFERSDETRIDALVVHECLDDLIRVEPLAQTAKASFIHPFEFITRFCSVVMRDLTAPDSIDEHALGVCVATRIGFKREESRAASVVRANFNVFAVERLVRAPHFDGIEFEHVNRRSGYASEEEIPGDFPKKKPRRAERLGSH